MENTGENGMYMKVFSNNKIILIVKIYKQKKFINYAFFVFIMKYVNICSQLTL